MSTTEIIISQIRAHHRQRRFAMKIQQKLDRALESYIRRNATQWTPDLDAKEREKINSEVRELIKRIRAGEDSEFAHVVAVSDKARAPADELRETQEEQMATLAAQLPVHEWIGSVRGFGAPGLATIVGEAGDISNYPNVAKLWKRLGFAPYEGLAGSTWKRESWRPRALKSEEWIAHPFSGERYGLIHQIAKWLVTAQVTSAEKSGTEFGKAKGKYGDVYVRRRESNKIKHADWTKQHSRQDALRIAMKELLKDLWREWHSAAHDVPVVRETARASSEARV